MLVTLADHARWADRALLESLSALSAPPADAVREFAHILGATDVWLARLGGRPHTLGVWPTLPLAELAAPLESLHAEFAQAVQDAAARDAQGPVQYTTTDGRTFSSMATDILMHVCMHGQYHRGKINLLLRQAGAPPAPVDLIAFIRGAAAAVTPQP